MKNNRKIFKCVAVFVAFIMIVNKINCLSFAKQSIDEEVYDEVCDEEGVVSVENNVIVTETVSANIIRNVDTSYDNICADGDNCNVKYYVNINGLTLTSKQQAQLLNSYKNRVINLPKLSQKGYVFVGWFIGDVKVNEISKNVSICKGDLDVIAKFYKKQSNIKGAVRTGTPVTITLEPNGGICNKPLTYIMTTNTVKLPKLTKKGYKFLGWFTNGVKVTKLSYKTNACQGKSSITCEALWAPEEYVISFNKNCKGTGTMDKYHMFYGYKSSLPVCNFFNNVPNAHFDGWRINKKVREGSIEADGVFGPEEKFNKTKVKLYAGWIYTRS